MSAFMWFLVGGYTFVILCVIVGAVLAAYASWRRPDDPEEER